MKMPTADEIRLAAGELTAGEMRSAKAVLQWFINTRCGEAEEKVVLATEKGLTPTGQHIADCERDAARYRWLRDTEVVDWDAMPLPVGYEHPDNALDSTAKMLDAAIDAAMSAQSDEVKIETWEVGTVTDRRWEDSPSGDEESK